MTASISVLPVIDGHTDLAATNDGWRYPIDASVRGGVSAAVVPARAPRVPADAPASRLVEELEATFAGLEASVAESEEPAAIARTADEVTAHAGAGVFSVIPALQNARGIDGLDKLASWIDRGVAVVDFGFSGDNQWVKSSRPFPYANVGGDFDGISDLAIDGIRLLNERGVIVDTAQVSRRARWRIAEVSERPVLASHNGLKAAVPDADRGLDDDEIRLIADTGGLVQVVAFDGYLVPRGDDPVIVAAIRDLRESYGLPPYVSGADYYGLFDQESAAWGEQRVLDYLAEYHERTRNGWPRTDVARFVDALEHVAERVGVDHVGVASDFHHGGGLRDWRGPSETAALTAELSQRFGESDAAKIWGGNFLRVWRAAGGR